MRLALALTAAMMVLEISGGYALNSMALLADGWHMSSHVLALGLAAFAYAAARHFKNDERFCFGTWKIEVLAGYTSALMLLAIAGLMLWHSVERLMAPVPIQYNQAIVIAAIGLIINLLCAKLLHGSHDHHHGHSHDGHAHHHHHSHHAGHSHHHGEQHSDLNLRSAYLHVLADAATSVLAIVALIGGKLWGAAWLDPLMGIVGSILVAIWAVGLLRETSRALLDAEMDAPIATEIRELLAGIADCKLQDLHVWRVSNDSYAAAISLYSSNNLSPNAVKAALAAQPELVHVTVEINQPLNLASAHFLPQQAAVIGRHGNILRQH